MSDPPASAASPVLVRVWNTRRPCFEPIAPRGDHWLLGRETLADDDRMSRRHCEIRFGAAGWVIEDLGSANGSHVNGSGWVAREPGGWWQVLQIGRSLVIPLCVPAGVPLRLRREQDVIVGPGLHRTWEAVGRAAQERGHLLLIGPRGCGFEGLARAYARARGAGVECSVQDLRRGTLPVATLTPGVVLVLGLGSLERLADDPWLRSAMQRADLRLVVGFESDWEWDELPGPPPLPTALASTFAVLLVPGLDARPEEIGWWIADAVQRHRPALAVDVTYPEACLLRAWATGIDGLVADTRTAIEHAFGQPLLRARDLHPSAGLPTHRFYGGGVAPPGGPRVPARALAQRWRLMEVMREAGGVPQVAAAKLAITLATLGKWLRFHGLDERGE